ncbi:MAG: Na+/H+ antiporter NhaC family protein [Oligoflexales bacterium]
MTTLINMEKFFLWAWIIPPFFLMCLSIKTRNSTISLLGALITASILASLHSSQHFFKIFFLFFNATFHHDFFSSPKYQIFKTMALLGIFTQALQSSGYSTAFTNAALKSLQNKKKAQITTASFSLCFCLDDYFSILTSGAIARPIFQRFHIPKTKLAWMLDSLASPVVALCPFSSWSPVILSFIIDAHLERISTSPTQAYWSTLPWLFYSYITIATTFWTLSNTPKQTAPCSKIIEKPYPQSNCNPWPFLTVFLLMITTTWISTLWVGGFFKHYTWHKAMQSASMSQSLQHGFIAGICVTLYSAKTQKKSPKKILFQSIEKSFPGFLLTVITLTMAWTLGQIMSQYLSMEEAFTLLLQNITIEWSPCFFFISSIFLAMTTGSSWATAALLFPTAANALITAQASAWLYPTFGAILSGSIAGDHLSPISDTTMLAAKSAQCSLHEHISTQFKQTLPNFITTLFGFFIIAWLPELTSQPHIIVIFIIFTAVAVSHDIWSDTQRNLRDHRQEQRPDPTPQTQQPTPRHNIQQKTNT